MSETVIKVENISKFYQLGLINHGTLAKDLQGWWAKIRGKEDPNSQIPLTNSQNNDQNTDFIYALKDVSFDVQQGEVLGIIGANGAGKSTLLKILSRVTSPTSGCIKIKGRIGSLLEVGTGFHPELTGRENIYLNGAILGMRKHEIDRKLDEIIDFSGVEKFIDTPVKRYSSGMYVRLAFAVAAHLDPEILVVDEVLAVGDADFQKKCLGKMGDVSKKEGRTVLFVSHNMAAVKNLCKLGVILKCGKILAKGDIDSIVEKYVEESIVDLGDIDICTNFNRLIETLKYLEIVMIKRSMPYKIDSLQDITFNVTIKKNKDIIPFKIVALIGDMDNDGNRVGFFVSNEICWPKGREEATFLLKIKNHHLSKGRYILDVWLCLGDMTINFAYVDAVYKTITFCVDSYGGTQIIEWHNYWGKSLYKMETILI